jgi:TetR/AcrR family transcriptional regulator, transcriptional repressor of bet genes
MPGPKAPETARREQILQAALAVALRRGIEGLTVRAVAAEARLSHGLVHFHFERKERLVLALLDWVLEATLTLPPSAEPARTPDPLQRLRTLLRREMERLSHEPALTRLFLEFWASGTRHPEMRARITAALARYRAAFKAVAEEVLRAEPARFIGGTPDALAAVAVSFINGCAVQAIIDPVQFDAAAYLAAVDGLVDRLRTREPEAGSREPARSARALPAARRK